ncbi:MAG TPA: TfoX/Sxy family protein [Burkholderiaceae bacterium]|nr:TfoX/Sxy family protein [Burkholderiaceae bacterium]
MQGPSPFVSHCLDLLAPLGSVRARRMFGGHGLYVDDLFVALIADERLYMKTDASSQPAFERAGCSPFAYSRRDRSAVTLGYWSAPDEALDSPRAMAPWARLSLAAALKSKPVQRPTRSGASQQRAVAARAASTRATKGRG